MVCGIPSHRTGWQSEVDNTLSAARQVRNKNRFDELKALGATEVIDVTTEDVPARVKEITGALRRGSSRLRWGLPAAAANQATATQNWLYVRC